MSAFCQRTDKTGGFTNAIRSADVPLKLSTSTGSLNPATVPVAEDCQNVQRVHGGSGSMTSGKSPDFGLPETLTKKSA